MSLRVTFELEDKDLEYFRKQMVKARKAAKKASEEEVVSKAASMLAEARKAGVPKFVAERLDKIESLVNMLGDEEWGLEKEEREDVVNALIYLAEPQDIIPDDVPVLGYIDDAIMIELVVKELVHEIEAYRDFCAYRQAAPKDRQTREDWLESKRRQLYARMRRRRSRGGRSGGARIGLF